jgi:hypothetical protein
MIELSATSKTLSDNQKVYPLISPFNHHIWKIGMTMLFKFFLFFLAFVFVGGCGGGASSSKNSTSSSSTSFSSSSSSSVSSIAVPISYEADGSCAEGSPYTLTITDGYRIDPEHLEKLVCNFFVTYPKIVALLSPNASKNIEFVFDPRSPYVAAAYGTVIVYRTHYLAGAPDDTDIVVHETTHAAQAELIGELPGWIVEGTADFVRDLYGLDSKDIWSIPTRYANSTGDYLSGYGNAAAFFKWIDALYRQNELPVAAAISRATLAAPYNDDLWVDLTGKSLEALWHEYKSFPVTPPFTTGVSVFNGANFTGREIKLERGNYDLYELLALGVTDNQIASIKVPHGYKLKAYVDINFAGEQMTFIADAPDIDASMALKISSIVIE